MVALQKYFTVLFLSLVVFTSTVFADAGDKKIKLLGNTNDAAPQYITPKVLAKTFKSIKVDLYNPWEKREDKYEGVLLSELAKKYGKNTNSLKLIALDDYTIEFLKDEYENERIMIAFKVNDEYISVRKKGPMRIVYLDYDPSKKRYENNLYKWMWMIKKIEFN